MDQAAACGGIVHCRKRLKTLHLGFVCGLNLHLDATATMSMLNRRGLGEAKHVDMQNLWIQEASEAGRFSTKKVNRNVNTAYVMTKPLLGPKIEQLMKILGCKFVEQYKERAGLHCARPACFQQSADKSWIVVILLLVTAP